ncbi:uncharacterized protein DMENIID0001_003190 [Sergentomyia squamirostris]
MKAIICLTLLVSATAAEIGISDYYMGHLVRSAIPIQPRSTPDEICMGQLGPRCGDCETMVLCVGAGIPPYVNKCPDDAPYCNKANTVCTASPPPPGECDDAVTDTGFTCTSNGYFPHPTDCTKFYECVNMQAYLGECNAGLAYSADGTRACTQKRTTSTCGTFNCKTYPGKTRPYSTNSMYYAYCGVIEANKDQKVIIFKCLAPNTYYQLTDQTCKFECREVKFYADAVDPHYYFNCYKSGTKWVYTREFCTLGRVFNEAQQDCVFA